ncbi:hypothetical protein D9M71_328740 [compost metagenome]
MVEQQAQGRQLHALGGEWLVYFMGQGRGHLPQRREFGRLHQTLLGGAQVAGAFFYQSFEFFATALAQLGHAPALIEKQQQEHQGQPQAGRSEGGIAAVFEGHLRATQQMQGPALGCQRQGLPQVVRLAVRAIDPDQVTVVVETPQRLKLQRCQGLLVVLAGGLEFGVIAVAERLEQAIAPARLVGDEDDPARVADQQRVAALAPLAFQFGKFQFHHHGAEELPVVIADRAGEEVAGNPAGHAYRVKTPGALSAGLVEIGTETVVVADITAGQTPIARRYGEAGAIEQFQGRGFGGAVDLFQFAVQRILLPGAHRPLECRAQLRIQRQHGGQGAVTFDQGMQRRGIERQLLIGSGGVFDH